MKGFINTLYLVHKTHTDFQKPSSTPTTPTLYKSNSHSDMALSLSARPIDIKRKITQESIEQVVQDIERLKLLRNRV
jgi:hypothetical protein